MIELEKVPPLARTIGEQTTLERIAGRIYNEIKKEYIYKIIRAYQGDIRIDEIAKSGNNIYLKSVDVYDRYVNILNKFTLDTLRNILLMGQDVGFKNVMNIINSEFKDEGI